MKSTTQGVVDEIYTIFLDEVLMHRCLLVGPSRMRFIPRHRRDALKACFSKNNATKLEPLIKDKVDLLCKRISGSEQPIVLSNAFMALTVDIIGEFVFGKKWVPR